MSAAITFSNVSKQFPGTSYYAVDQLSFSVEEGEFVTILGSSGCGKTTLLKMINRLYEPDEGNIYLFGENTAEIDVVQLRRGIGYVIQQTGLFPHMTIADNVATVPRLLKWDKERIQKRVRELLELVKLDPDEFQGRYPSQLSAGSSRESGWRGRWQWSRRSCCWTSPSAPLMPYAHWPQEELLGLHRGLGKTFLW